MFLPEATPKLIKPSGSPEAKVAIVGDFPNRFDLRNMQAFSGPAGTVLEQCFHSAGFIKSDLYLTNVFKIVPDYAGTFYQEYKKQILPEALPHVQAFYEEINSLDVNVIVACGPMAAQILCGTSNINTYRGYVFRAVDKVTSCNKIIPTLSPGETIRGNYLGRYLISHDLQKAKIEASTKSLIIPERKLAYTFNSLSEVMDWIDYFLGEPIVSFDIEVTHYELASIAFSSDPNLACSIPLDERWSVEEEAIIYRGIQSILGNKSIIKVGQNLIFDIQFLLARCGIVVDGPIYDTMIAHSVMYPDLKKGLGFLGSIYLGNQPYWKDMVKFNNIKDEA